MTVLLWALVLTCFVLSLVLGSLPVHRVVRLGVVLFLRSFACTVLLLTGAQIHM